MDSLVFDGTHSIQSRCVLYSACPHSALYTHSIQSRSAMQLRSIISDVLIFLVENYVTSPKYLLKSCSLDEANARARLLFKQDV